VGRQESWLYRVQLHSTDLHHGLKTVGSLFKNAFLTRVHRFLTRVHSCSSFLTRVHSCSHIFDSCSLVFVIFDSCSLVFVSFWLVFTNFWLVFTNFWLVFTRVVSCSLVLSRVHSCSDWCGLLEQIHFITFVNCFDSNYYSTGKKLKCLLIFIVQSGLSVFWVVQRLPLFAQQTRHADIFLPNFLILSPILERI
jgi:hypothetical protein